MSRLTTGLRVYSKDGKYLGDISELRGGLFKLDAPMAVDYWLSDAEVEKVEHGSVLLGFHETEMREHRIEAGATGS